MLAKQTYSAGPLRFGIGASGPLAARLHAAFVDLVDDSLDDVDEWFIVSDRVEDPRSVELAFSGATMLRAPEFAEAAIVSALNRMILDYDPQRLHLHAACLGLHGVGVVLAARSGTGKSTTTASLALDGWTYLSDESLGLRGGSARVEGVPKPISLTPDAFDLLRADEGGQSANWPAVLDRMATHKVLCSASGLGAQISDSVDCGIVALLARGDGAQSEPRVEATSIAEMVVELLGLTQDFGRFGPTGLDALVDLCCNSRCLRMTLGTPLATARLLRRLVDDHVPPPRVHVEIIDFMNTRTAFMQEEAVVLNCDTMSAVSLLPSTAACWYDEISQSVMPESDRSTPATDVSDLLRELGILDPSTPDREALGNGRN